MKPMRPHLLMAGVLSLFANAVHSSELASLDVNQLDLNNIALTEKEFKNCKPDQGLNFSKARQAIALRQYDDALKILGKPSKADSAEHHYLYGKLHYLLAYQSVQQGAAAQPDPQQYELAETHISQAADTGFGEALYDKAVLFTSPNETTKKIALLRKAADKHFVPAMLSLAEEIFVASGTYEERIEAQSLIQKAAELDTDARIKLASYYLHEDPELKSLTGYEKNTNKAVYLLYEAAQQCNADAAYKLHQLASHEHKPNRLDPSRAVYWLESSARLGSPVAQGELAYHYLNEKQDQQTAIKWAERAAEQGDLKALLTLGRIYYSGTGIDRDLPRALQYYEQALNVDKNNRLVQNQLGMMYYKGEGGTADFRRAASLCKQAANKGQAGCQYYLGLMYINGEGVTQDINTGISWMKKSASQDYSSAKNWLRENW